MNRPARSSRSRAGLTMMEVVIAVATLALSAGVILGGVGFVQNVAQRDRTRLDAMEVAHRIVLQHIDDPEALKGQVHRIELNGHYYAYTLADQIVENPDGDDATPSDSPRKLTAIDSSSAGIDQSLKSKLTMVTVRVYPDDDNRGPMQKTAAAELVRVYNWLSGIDSDTLLQRLLGIGKMAEEIDKQNVGQSGPPGGASNRK